MSGGGGGGGQATTTRSQHKYVAALGVLVALPLSSKTLA